MPPAPEFPPAAAAWTARVGDLLRTNGNQHQEATVQLYLRWLWRLYQKSGTDRDVLDPEWLADPATVLDRLGPDLKASSRAAYMKAVLNLLSALQLRTSVEDTRTADIYRTWIVAYTRESNAARSEAFQMRRVQQLPPTLHLHRLQRWLRAREKEIAAWNDREPLEPEQIRLLLQHLYVALMVGHPDFPPIRAEYEHLPIVYGPADPLGPNYLRVPADLRRNGRWELVLRQYKTSQEYGDHRRILPEPLREVLRRSLRLFPRRYVLSLLRDGDKPLGDLSNLTHDIVPEAPLGASTLRALFVRDYASQQPMERQLWLARQMMHDIKTSFAIYRGGGRGE